MLAKAQLLATAAAAMAAGAAYEQRRIARSPTPAPERPQYVGRALVNRI